MAQALPPLSQISLDEAETPSNHGEDDEESGVAEGEEGDEPHV